MPPESILFNEGSLHNIYKSEPSCSKLVRQSSCCRKNTYLNFEVGVNRFYFDKAESAGYKCVNI
ncbi:hypothetical protein ACS0TY_013393 [Phlomoides rotata]